MVQSTSSTALFQTLHQYESTVLIVDELQHLLSGLKNSSTSNAIVDILSILLEAYQHDDMSKLTMTAGESSTPPPPAPASAH